MINMSEARLAEYLDHRDKQKNSRFLADRVFRGVIWRVAQNGSTYTVSVIRQGESVQDQTSYFCYVPGYYPIIGDVIDLIWRSGDEAVVLAPVQFNPLRMRGIQSIGQSIPNNAWTGITLIQDYDPTNSFDPVSGTFTAWLTGYYDMRIKVSFTGVGAAGTRIGTRLGLNGASIPLQQISAPVTVGTQTVSAYTSDIILLSAGDAIQMFGYQDSGGALTTDFLGDAASGLNAGVYLTIQFVGA